MLNLMGNVIPETARWREGVGLLRTSQLKVDSVRLEAPLEVTAGTSLQNRGLHAGNRSAVIGGMLLVGIMNSVVSAEVIGRALLQ